MADRLSQPFLRLELKCKPVSWNSIVSSHWRKYKQLKDEMVLFTSEALHRALKDKKLEPIVYPVDIVVHAKWKGRRVHDIENIFVKPVNDFLIMRGILEGDDIRFVKSMTFSGKIDAKEDGLIFEIWNGNKDMIE